MVSVIWVHAQHSKDRQAENSWQSVRISPHDKTWFFTMFQCESHHAHWRESDVLLAKANKIWMKSPPQFLHASDTQMIQLHSTGKEADQILPLKAVHSLPALGATET